MPRVHLIGNKVTEISKALGACYPTWETFSTALQSINIDASSLQRLGLSYGENRNEIVKDGAKEGWLLRLVEESLRAVPGDADLVRIKDFLKPFDAPAGVDCFDVCRLSGSHLMLNRGTLRLALREIAKPLGKRILIVAGAPKTGKTHSAQLISYIARVLNAFKPTFVDLEAFIRMRDPRQPVGPVQPQELAQRIIRLLDLNMELPEEPRDGQWARWVMDFCDDFESAATAELSVQWLIIDGFNSVLLSDAALDLVKELAQRINVGLTHYRLILLGYDFELPIQVLPIVEAERTSRITQEDLIQFLATASDQSGRVPDEQIIADAVQRILAQVDPADPDFLVRLIPLTYEELVKIAA